MNATLSPLRVTPTPREPAVAQPGASDLGGRASTSEQAGQTTPSSFAQALGNARANSPTARGHGPTAGKTPKPAAPKAATAGTEAGATTPSVTDASNEPTAIDTVANLVASVLGLTAAPKAAATATSPKSAPASDADSASEAASDAEVAPDSTSAADSVSVSTKPDAASDSDLPASPLERAIHDLLQRIAAPTPASATTTAPALPIAAPVTPSTDAPTTAAAPAPVTGISTVHDLPAPVAAELQSHLHLVLGDGDQRVVLTVAVRGSDVHVAVRGADEHATAALARNAAVLDEALRHRGLALAELSTADDAPEQRPPRERAPRDTDPDPEPQPEDEPFRLADFAKDPS